MRLADCVPTPQRFQYDTYVSVGDTNCFGTVYFTRYFEWQGRAREAFFRSVVPTFDMLLDTGHRVLTVTASMEYFEDLQVFEPIQITMELAKLQQTSLELVFAFHRAARPVALGRQRLVLVDAQGKPTVLPSEVRSALTPYVASSGVSRA